MKVRWREQRLLILRALGTLLAIVLLIVLFREEGSSDVTAALARISPGEFLLALAFLLLSRVFVIARWHVLLTSAGMPIPFRRTASLTLTGLFASNFLPTTIGGDVVRLTGAIRMGLDRAICLASLVADRAIGMLGMAIALPFGLFPFLANVNSGAAQALQLSGLGERLMTMARKLLAAFAIWTKRPAALFGSLLCTLANMSLIFAALYTLIHGLHGTTTYQLIAGLWSLTYFVTLIPISINGYGVQELSLSFLLNRVGGMGTAESLSVAVLIRVLFILASLPGAVSLPRILEAVALARTDDVPG